ncbi:lysophospholipase [Cutibacterium sp. WCA-380-WT-3A]|uniref:Lysophospholipase n=1 Tax=Cutibacterium porci TaxID=2605781 RepID=A0A7K0J731_9ACTN|nr:alpha/beta fold hydrolase [Cutibacterium porci]MSS45742.1 lysophospholipase [Cutibacterium porci]
MSEQKMQRGGAHSFRMRMTAGLVAGVTAFSGLSICAQAAPVPTHAPVASSAPSVVTTTNYMTSTDRWGTKIFTKTDAVADPKGVIVVVPGAGEHLGRYDYITKRFNDANYSVYRLDHRGHGRSARPYVDNVVPRGHLDNWSSVVSDVHELVGRAKQQNPGKKVFLVGHSMGAMAVQSFGITYPGEVDGIVSNAGGIFMNPFGKDVEQPEVVTAKNLTPAEQHAKPTVSQLLPLDQITSVKSSLLPQVIKDPRGFDHPSLAASALIKYPNTLVLVPGAMRNGVCTDPEVEQQMMNDPLNNRYATQGLLTQMVVGQLYNTFNARDFKDPTLIMHGQADGLAPSYADVNWLNAIGSKDKKAVFWKGLMHEVFNETVKDQPIDMVLSWINDHNK